MAGWYEKYGPQGFVVVGIHSPEFAWEHDLDKVRKACKRLGVKFPVALDNDFATWKRYGTRYWPTLHIVDKGGVVRYTRFGERGYGEMEREIRRLLKE